MKGESHHIPRRRACFLIFGFTLLISGTAWFAFWWHSYFFSLRSKDPKYQIIALVQTGPEREALQTGCLAEVLGLSMDAPTNLYALNLEEARRKLLAFPLIKEALLRRISPGTLYIDYTIRKPFAFLGDYTNTAVDEEGVLFPFSPFFTPKNLPEIYFGLMKQAGGSIWGKVLEGRKAELGLQLAQAIMIHCCSGGSRLIRLDLSCCFAQSEGEQQLIALLEDRCLNEQQTFHTEFHLLRLGTKNYLQGLGNYLVLRDFLRDKRELLTGAEDRPEKQLTIIDLRIPKLGFIKKETIHD